MKLEIDLIKARLRAPFVSASGSVSERELLLVRLEGADGVVGFGEAAPLEHYDGLSIEQARAALEDCRGLLAESDATEHDDLLRACAAVAVLPQALAAIDLALWDLAGRRAGEPVWKLLGAQAASPVQVNATIAAEDRAGAAREASAAAEAGFGCVKVKVGLGDDAGRLAAVRAAAGREMAIRIDANGAWSVDEALASLRALEPVGIELCEEPCSGLQDNAEVCALGAVWMSYVGLEPLQDSSTRDETLPTEGATGVSTSLPVRTRRAAHRRNVETDAMAVVRRRERIFRRMLVSADGGAAALAALIAITAQTGYQLRVGFLLVLPLMIVVAKLQGMYDQDDLVIRKSTLDELPKLVNLATLMTMLIWLSRHFLVAGAPGTKDLLKLWILLILFTMVGRMVARSMASRAAPVERCFFVGDLTTAERLRSKLENTKSVELVGATAASQVELDEEALTELVKRFEIHRIIVAASAGVAEKHVIDVVRAAKAIGLRVTISPGMSAVLGSSLVMDDVWGMPLLGVPRFGLSRSSAVVKRAFDVVGAAAGLVVVAPFFALVGLLIKLDAPGPVFFRQMRVGRDGELFEIFKLRTMVVDAEALKDGLREHNESEGIFKMKADPRITRIGRLLRKTSLDELAQLINVLRGQMSLVGPRPLILDEDELITGFDRRRLAITPGMTGSWQILGSARIPLHEMIKLDYMYVANWSLWLDVKILLRTVGVVFARQGL